jgi:hypothetical protein
MTTPKGFREIKRELEERNQISRELQKMHEIFGDPNCGTAARYEDGTCSKIFYDPLYPNEQLEAPSNPETEHQAKRVVEFSNLINPKTRRT